MYSKEETMERVFRLLSMQRWRGGPEPTRADKEHGLRDQEFLRNIQAGVPLRNGKGNFPLGLCSADWGLPLQNLTVKMVRIFV